MHWSDHFSAGDLREMFKKPTNSWSEEYLEVVNQWLADELLDSFLESHDDQQYRERIKGIVEDMTYGYEDNDGKEMLDFDTN